jgi:hypothetical protein
MVGHVDVTHFFNIDIISKQYRYKIKDLVCVSYVNIRNIYPKNLKLA